MWNRYVFANFDKYLFYLQKQNSHFFSVDIFITARRIKSSSSLGVLNIISFIYTKQTSSIGEMVKLKISEHRRGFLRWTIKKKRSE